jgi:hypothetical protein
MQRFIFLCLQLQASPKCQPLAAAAAAAGMEAFEEASVQLVGVLRRAEVRGLEETWAKITQRLNKAVQVS